MVPIILEFEIVKASDSIEMLIYCLYIIIENIAAKFDRRVLDRWECLVYHQSYQELCVIDYMTFISPTIK